jgi:Uma2 family endonuclease
MVSQVEKPILSTVELPQQYSPEEYLGMEVRSEDRHEYSDGEIVLITGATPNHNRIARNLCTLITIGLKGQSLEVFVADQRLWIPLVGLHTYPDVMVIEGALALQPGRKDTIMNPILVIEVLSKSTQSYDRGDKFAAYRTIPDFREYLLIDQYRQHIEHYVKISAKKWDFQEYDEMDIVVPLRSIALKVAIADIYDKVEFAAPVEVE